MIFVIIVTTLTLSKHLFMRLGKIFSFMRFLWFFLRAPSVKRKIAFFFFVLGKKVAINLAKFMHGRGIIVLIKRGMTSIY